MPPAEPGAHIVRPIADDGVRYGIDHKRQEQCASHKRGSDTEYLTVVKQQEVLESVILHAAGRTANSIGDAGQQAWLTRNR